MWIPRSQGLRWRAVITAPGEVTVYLLGPLLASESLAVARASWKGARLGDVVAISGRVLPPPEMLEDLARKLSGEELGE
jgi:hypothetical protein